MTAPSAHQEGKAWGNDMRCVWMTAGVLSYQLCDRDFDCDACPLDAAMKKHFCRGIDEPDRQANESERLLNPDLRYTKHHTWAWKIDDGVFRIGIEAGLSAALLNPKAIVFPANGERVSRENPCVWIVTEGGTYPIVSPLTGIVTATNPLLTDEPHEVHLHPLDTGWLFEIRTEKTLTDEEQKELLPCSDIRRPYEQDESHLRDLLIEAMRDQYPAVGMTLADGGQILRDVSDMLGARRYFSLVSRAFPS